MALADETLHVTATRPSAARGVEGFFRAGQETAGRWSMLAPDGQPWFCRAVHGVCALPQPGDAAPPRDVAARLRGWGFNALGAPCERGLREDGFPFLATVNFCEAAPHFAATGVRLPDVFNPEWPQLAAARAAESCTPLAGCRELIGWVTDDAIAWPHLAAVSTAGAPVPAGRVGLLQRCLSLEPSFAAYHAAWEFALALHGGRMDALARAWGVAIANKEVVREMTRTDAAVVTRGYLRDEARWQREFARRYFTTTAAAIRAADPNHLVMGCRFQTAATAAVLAECVYPAVDVAMPAWTELPVAIDAAPHPVLAGEVGWVSASFVEPGKRGDRRLTAVERMLRRARHALDRMARHPGVVGFAWGQWQDAPGEQPPFGRGLIHANGAEAREHTELIADFNRRVDALRRTLSNLNPS